MFYPTCKQTSEAATASWRHKTPVSEMDSFLPTAIAVPGVSAFVLLPCVPVSTGQCEEG